MTTLASDRIWRKRLDEIDTIVEDIRFPDVDDANSKIDQDEEWCEVVVDGERRRIRFHDYSEVFKIPGLYELLFYERLQCCSPSCVAKLLTDVARDFDDSIEEFRVLDVGAGNGMVGDELSHLGVDQVFGVDITPVGPQGDRTGSSHRLRWLPGHRSDESPRIARGDPPQAELQLPHHGRGAGVR